MPSEKIFEIFSNSRYLYRNLIRYMCRRVYKGLLNLAFADGGDAGMNNKHAYDHFKEGGPP